TLDLDDLPREVGRWVRSVAELSTWEKALAAQEFVQTRYGYDPAYRNAPEVRRAVGSLKPGRGNHHLSLLHARRTEQTLGFGICYELNVMVAELLRHLGVPALVATGWILDEGQLDRPDHLFAVAWLASTQGPCLLPLDATTTQAGPQRPLGRRSTAPSVPALPVPAGAWGASGAVRSGLSEVRLTESRLRELELAMHAQALTLVLSARGRSPEPEWAAALQGGPFEERVRVLRAALDELLGNAELSGALLRLLGGEFQAMPAVHPLVERLRDLGLAEIRTATVFQAIARKPG
ncbi:MAG: transglutaminase-like domain-containing protein, partial [Candidatus Eremiobacterota bacterium]